MRQSHLHPHLTVASNMRRLKTMEIVARAFGATDPSLVASHLDPNCKDLPKALEALRLKRPQWFGAASSDCEALRATARAAAAGTGSHVPMVVFNHSPVPASVPGRARRL